VAIPPSETGMPERRRSTLLAAATFSQFGASLTQQGTQVLGVFFAATYALGLGGMGTLLAVLTAGWVVSALFVGSLVDRFGPRRVLLVGTLLLTLLSSTLGITTSLPGTAVLLFLLGLSLGTVPLSGTKAILMAWPRARRGLPMGVRQMGVPLGAMVAALILPTLANRVGLHPLYFGFALLLAICGFTFVSVLPSEMPGDTLEAGETPTRLRAEAKRVTVPAICGFLMSWGQYSLTTFSIPLLHGSLGFSLAVAGILLAASQAGGAAARMLLGALSDRLGARREIVLTVTAATASALACVLAWLPHNIGIAVLAPLWVLLGMAFVGWNALLLTWAGERVSVANAGAAMGLTTSAILTGATVCAPIFGFIVEVSGTYRDAWLTLASLLLIAALLLWTQWRREGRVAGVASREQLGTIGRR